MFSSSDPFCGIDLDDALDLAGKPKTWAQGLVERFCDTYMEISPSGTGLKIWARGNVPTNLGGARVGDGQIEIYDHSRYFAVTRHAFRNAPLEIEDHAADLHSLYEHLSKRRKGQWTLQPISGGRIPYGQQHNTLVSIAGTLRRRRVCDEAIEACLQTINTQQCEHPGPPEHIARIVRSSKRWGDGMSAEPVAPDWLAGLRSQTPPPDNANARSAGDWQERLLQTEKGIKACLENALVALEYAPEWKGVLHFDESALQVVAKAPPPWDSRAVPFPWRDEDSVRSAAWMQRQGIMVSKEIVGQAIQTVARMFPFHPIRKYLNGLKWDGIARIDGWLTLYLSVEASDYTRAIGSKWLIGAVARVFVPGCKNDTCLVLEGPQGLLNSTALRALATPWFTDEISDLGTKDSVSLGSLSDFRSPSNDRNIARPLG